ncbi:MAG: hypothetical protein AB7G68_21410 [Nitrospiraceae bacterium]
MKPLVVCLIMTALFLGIDQPVQSESDLMLNRELKEGAKSYYDHPSGIVLADGFWAKAGSDFTATIASTSGFSIDKAPLDAKDKRYTSNESRTFVVAGCVPKNLPIKGVSGSVWVACNDLDLIRDKVQESKFVSCLDLYPNGVLQEFFIKEVNSRDWESFRFSCGDLLPDGTVGSPVKKAPFLFDFEKDGKLYETSVPRARLSLGIFELEHYIQFRESLLTVALYHHTAQAIFDSGATQRRPDGIHLTDKVPPSAPASGIRYHEWFCPPGMVVTGAAIGHIPNKKDKHTRPVYILAECRKLLHRS